MASTPASIAELLRSGVTLTPSEAVALARAAIACKRLAAAVQASSDELSLPDAMSIDADGGIVCRGRTTTPSVADVALLLRTLLPAGSPGVPGGLRYAIARALREVDAPPFESAEDFSSVLGRYQTGDEPQIVRGLLARIPASDELASRVVIERRRPNGGTVSNLRHALREADSRLYDQQRSPAALAPSRPSRARRALAIAAGLSAAVVLFAAGAATRDRLTRTPAAPPADTALRVPPADIVLEAAPRNARLKPAPIRARNGNVRARTISQRETPKGSQKRGFFARMHMEWLRKAFS